MNVPRGAARSLLALLALVSLEAAAGAAGTGGEAALSPVLAALRKSGWAASGPVRAFSPDTLYEEIDGEAELYLPYDFRALAVAILASPSAPGVELRLEAYRHGSPADAFGIFSQYRFQDQETARVGPALAAVSDASLDFFRGDTFVRLRVASGTLSREALLAAGGAVSDALDGSAEPPPGAAVVAIPSAVGGTVIYQKKSMLGFEPLAPGYEARFSDGALSGRAIRIEGSGTDAERLARLAKALPGFREAGKGAWTAGLPQGTLFLEAAGGGFVGVVGRMTRAQAAPALEALRRNAEAAHGGGPPRR